MKLNNFSINRFFVGSEGYVTLRQRETEVRLTLVALLIK